MLCRRTGRRDADERSVELLGVCAGASWVGGGRDSGLGRSSVNDADGSGFGNSRSSGGGGALGSTLALCGRWRNAGAIDEIGAGGSGAGARDRAGIARGELGGGREGARAAGGAGADLYPDGRGGACDLRGCGGDAGGGSGGSKACGGGADGDGGRGGASSVGAWDRARAGSGGGTPMPGLLDGRASPRSVGMRLLAGGQDCDVLKSGTWTGGVEGFGGRWLAGIGAAGMLSA
jgi:hypothetical protein